MSTPNTVATPESAPESTVVSNAKTSIGKTPEWGWLGIFAITYLAFIYIPVMFLPLFSFNDSTYIAFPLKGFTLEWYTKAFETDALFAAFYNSIKVGVPVAIISTVFGTLAAKAVTRYRMPGKAPMMSFIMAPLVIPAIVVGIGLLIIINWVGFPLSLYTIAFAHIPGCIAFSMWIMISRLEGFDSSVEEASLDLGEGAWMTFWRITFPLILPGAIASLLLTFTISFDEYILASFLAGSEATLPIYIFSQLRFPAALPGVLALGTLILVASFVLVYFAEWFRRRGVQLKTDSGV